MTGFLLIRGQLDKSGITSSLLREYLIVSRVAGPLAPQAGQPGAIDPEKLDDVLIEVGYGLV